MESVLPDRLDRSNPRWGPAIVGDLDLLLTNEGRERTASEYRACLNEADLEIAEVSELAEPSAYSLIVAEPT